MKFKLDNFAYFVATKFKAQFKAQFKENLYLKLISLSCIFLLVLDLTELDLFLANLVYVDDFLLRNNFISKVILHDFAQKFAWLVYFALLGLIVFARTIFKQLSKLQRTQLALMPLISILVITIVKTLSNTSCPWHLEMFGGAEQYQSHLLNFFTAKNGAGNCFPAGHATSGFAFIGGFFIWRKQHPKLARIWLIASISAGLFFGAVQQLRGAHFLSHTLWSTWLCFACSYASFNFLAYLSTLNKTKFKADIGKFFKLKLNALALVLITSLYLTFSGNVALFSKLQQYELFNLPLSLGLSVIIFALLNFILGLLAYRYVLKINLIILLLITASAAYFANNYGVLVDPSMIQNILQTDSREAYDLISAPLIKHLIIFVFLPILWLSTVKIKFLPFKTALWRSTLFAFVNLVLAFVTVWIIFQQLSSSMRNHKDLRYLLNPLASLYSATAVAVRSSNNINQTLQSIGTDAVLTTGNKPKFILLVIGETARAGNFSLNGYERETNAHLKQINNVVSFTNVTSCGTNTADSLPCMFAHLGRDAHIKSKNKYENLLDVLDRAGLAVLWLDNQSGCKGVCKRVPNFEFNNAGFDEQMLTNIDEHIAKLDANKVKNGVVIVMHQMGSHGPAYYLRSPLEHKKFMPECTSSYLSACSKESLFNVYDNSIVYTDYFLAQSINYLQKHNTNFDTALIYVSDHGESLGERNIYLHGMPYAIAPKQQKHVPMITWISDQFNIDNNCLTLQKDNALNHDYLFHSVLGIMQVKTNLYDAKLDIFAKCK